MPFTFGAFALASLSMIGVAAGRRIRHQVYLLVGAFDAGSIGILVVLLVSTLLNAAYFVPVVYQGFFGKVPEGDAGLCTGRRRFRCDSPLRNRRDLGPDRRLSRFLHAVCPRRRPMKLLASLNFCAAHLKVVVRISLRAALPCWSLLDAIPGMVDKEHAHTAAEHFPAFWCGVRLSRLRADRPCLQGFGHAGIMRREDYYDE